MYNVRKYSIESTIAACLFLPDDVVVVHLDGLDNLIHCLWDV